MCSLMLFLILTVVFFSFSQGWGLVTKEELQFHHLWGMELPIVFSLLYLNDLGWIKLNLLSELSHIGCHPLCCVMTLVWFGFTAETGSLMLFLLSVLFYVYADMETNALGVYHQIRGLYLMSSWLMLIADFSFYHPFFRFLSLPVSAAKWPGPISPGKMSNSHYTFTIFGSRVGGLETLYSSTSCAGNFGLN